MANYKTVVTNIGLERLAKAVATGQKLNLIGAKVGSGRPSSSPEALVDIVTPQQAEILVQPPKSESAPGSSKTIFQIPVEVTNKDLKAPLPIRELGIFGQDADGAFLFAYSFLEGPDTDNVLPLSQADGKADTKHLFVNQVVLTNQEAGSVSVEISLGAGITYQQMEDYAAPKDHTHSAADIEITLEETGQSLQEVLENQHRQLNDPDLGTEALSQKLQTHLQNTYLHLQGAQTAEDNTFYGKQEGAFGFYPATATRLATLALEASKWEAAPNTAELYRQQVTAQAITSQVQAGKTALDCRGDIGTCRQLQDMGVEELWLENQNGTVMAYASGTKPRADVAVQVRIVGIAAQPGETPSSQPEPAGEGPLQKGEAK